ncbi:MAG: YdeI/OmpD-associated family protein [Bacilli bacterium]|jgi:uncharacterized protein YdeI (YjbR/CyaY-like superfamily)
MIFRNRSEFRKWLYENHETNPGISVTFSKGQTLTYAEALEEALCFGWIDGVVNSIGKNEYTRYFTKRVKKSNWSEKNKKTVLELINRGLVTPSGMKAIAEAKESGMWNRLQNSDVSEHDFEEFRSLIAKSKSALTNYDGMSLSVRRTYVLFYKDAKTEAGRTSRLDKIISRLEQNLKPM